MPSDAHGTSAAPRRDRHHAGASALPPGGPDRAPRRSRASHAAGVPVDPWRRPWFWASFAAYWIVFGLLFTGTHFTRGQSAGLKLSLLRAGAIAFTDTFFLAVSCLGAFALAWHLPLEGDRRRRNRNLALAALLTPIATAALQWTMTSATSAIAGVPVPPLHVLILLTSPTQLLLFTAFLGAGYAIRYFARSRERALAAARLEGELTRAELQLAQTQLQVLKMQLDPHFLFNTFNAITTLMYRDVGAADAMLMRLSELLRLTLSRSGSEEVALGEELDFLRIYLEIQQTRFGDRLCVEWQIQPGTEGACVPHLVLQPIVENAIQHGIAQVPGPGRLRIEAAREGERLRLCVLDSGPGLPDEWAMRPGGVGLSATHARLERMYGDQQALELRNVEGGGMRVTITIPFRLARWDRARSILPEPERCEH
jgi:signal transduction histidine kinase